MNRDTERARERQRMVRLSALYTIAFFGAAAVVAIGGSAMVAWLLSRTGLPFGTTWLIILAIVVLPAIIGTVLRSIRSRRSGVDIHRE